MTPDHAQRLAQLHAVGQPHLLDFWSELNLAQRQELCRQIESVDFELIQRLLSDGTDQSHWAELGRRADPPPTLAELAEPGKSQTAAIELGLQALADGEVAFVLVAGGQGSRLGFSYPKGMFPIGPVSNRSLFQVILDQIHATVGGVIEASLCWS